MTKELCGIANLFMGHTAWFSSSVLPKTRGLWLALGGTECSYEKADFVFSSDANTPDTASIFMDVLYCKQGLAVIDPAYIKACIVAENISDVVLGDYMIYPESVKKFIKEQRLKKMCPVKTKENSSTMKNQTGSSKSLDPDRKTENKKMTGIEKKKSITSHLQESEEDAVNVSDMELISGDLDDFIPGKNKCQVYNL